MQAFVGILGRLCLCAIFALAAVGDAQNFNKIEPDLSNHLRKHPQLQQQSVNALIAAIVVLSVGSISVIFGYKARFGAFLLLLFLAAATYFYHDFWTITVVSEESQMNAWRDQLIQFMKNLGLAGAMLFIIANGAGAGSLDRMLKERKVPPGPVVP
jgi:putative oxidoreductase